MPLLKEYKQMLLHLQLYANYEFSMLWDKITPFLCPQYTKYHLFIYLTDNFHTFPTFWVSHRKQRYTENKSRILAEI